MSRRATKPKRPSKPVKPPRLDTARDRLAAAWANPTEEGLRSTRRALVRAMWRARRAQAPGRRAELRNLYLEVCRMQQAQEWAITDAERASRQRNRGNPGQYRREQAQRQGSSALLALSAPQERYQSRPASPSTREIISAPAPGMDSGPVVPEPLPTPAPYRVQRISGLRTAAVHHLARVLYQVHLRGWPSLSLHTSHSVPTGQTRLSTSGGVRYAVTLPVDGIVVSVDALLTSSAYQRALARLSLAQQAEIRSYYRRSSAKGDICPELENWGYRATTEAFSALLDALFDQGSLT